MNSLADSKSEKVAEIIREIYPSKINKLLVVGCGTGLEAAILAEQLNAEVVGIDIEENFDERAKKRARLQKGDATALQFSDDSFDFVFSFHALEHIENPGKALREMRRVLKNEGGFWIGTPNKSRIFGYIGGKEASFRQKIEWNITDWKARLAGRFENELGAHAGFTAPELQKLLSEVFGSVENKTQKYFSTVYANRPRILKLIAFSGASAFIYPSVYFSGLK